MEVLNLKKKGIFAEPNFAAKKMVLAHPKYTVAFKAFDLDHSGFIDVGELNNALLAVKQQTEAGTPMSVFKQPFQPITTVWLVRKFNPTSIGAIGLQPFAEMMQYLETLQYIFREIDVDNSGTLNVAELSRVLNLSGFTTNGFVNGGGDPVSMAVAEKIGRSYDADRNGVLTFDEFVQLRLEWDEYLDIWGSHVPLGEGALMAPALIHVLEAIKKSLEPLYAMSSLPQVTVLPGFSANQLLGGMFYNSMFATSGPFQLSTVECLIRKFAGNIMCIKFEQFCMLMEFLKDQKRVFQYADLNKNGTISVNELNVVFAQTGLAMPLPQLMAVANRYDADNNGQLTFDEFVRMTTELYPNAW